MPRLNQTPSLRPSKYDLLPAIPAAKNRLGEELVYRGIVRWGVWNCFGRVRVQLHGALPGPDDGPLIVYSNHPGWWDGHMIFLIHRELLRRRFESYVMMKESEIRAFRFFTWCGAFSIDRRRIREAARSVAYISRLLREHPARCLYIFPQGEITPNDRRPLLTYRGAAHIARRVGGATLLPVTLRYEFRGQQRPEAFIRIGPSHRVVAPVDVRSLASEITCRMTEGADALRDAVLHDRLDDFGTLVDGRPGVDRIFDLLLGRFLRRV